MGGPQPVLDVALQEGCSLWLHAKLIWATARQGLTLLFPGDVTLSIEFIKDAPGPS